MNAAPPRDLAWTQRDSADGLSHFFLLMRRNWGVAVSIWTASIAAALMLAFLLPVYWKVDIVVMPVAKNNSVNIGSALSGGIGGLGALLGRPGAGQDEAMAVLRSRELFDTYAVQKNLLPVLYADRWSPQAGRWDVAPSRVPTLRQAYKLFDTKIRDIDVDRRSGIITLAITWKDRYLAAQWARDLIALANQQLRERAIADAQRNMDYLSGELGRAGATSAQNALTAALSGAYDHALQDYMFAKGQPDFAFQIIDPPTIPDERERVWPNRPLFAALGLLLGGLLAVTAAYLSDMLKARRAPTAAPSMSRT